jgi:tRNA(Ile)-lysidine synthase
MRAGAPLPGAPGRLLVRPFLGVARQHILDYAQAHRLAWVDDPSNQDLRYARNRVRRELSRALLEDPGSLQRGLAAIGGYQASADAARRQAALDLAACRLHLMPAADHRGEAIAAGSPAGLTLSKAALGRLPPDRAGEAVRLWLEQSGLRMPSRAKLAEMTRQLVTSESTHARLRHDGAWLLRYRDRIDAADSLPAEVVPTWFRWSGEALLTVAGHQFAFHRLVGGSASSTRSGVSSLVGPGDGEGDVSSGRMGAGRDEGVDAGWLARGDLMMDKARSTDRLRLAAGGARRTCKNLVQERGIPPWMRRALPVLRRGDEIAYAAPFGVNIQVLGNNAAAQGGERVAIEWLAPPHWRRWL